MLAKQCSIIQETNKDYFLKGPDRKTVTIGSNKATFSIGNIPITPLLNPKFLSMHTEDKHKSKLSNSDNQVAYIANPNIRFSVIQYYQHLGLNHITKNLEEAQKERNTLIHIKFR